MTTRKQIDFTPVRKGTTRQVSAPGKRAVVVKRTTAKPVVRKTTTRPVATVKSAAAVRPVVTKSAAARVIRNTTAKPRTQAAPVQKSSVKLGEIEDLNPKFVMTNVPKRPLNDGKDAGQAKSTATEAKSKRIGSRLRLKSAKKSVAKSETVQNAPKKAAYTVPKSPFINQDKVAKRPLSRNVYKKQLDALEKASKETKGAGKTVTIISKPEKESHIGVVITIILTIILGAVAGTVAFLLLPK